MIVMMVDDDDNQCDFINVLRHVHLCFDFDYMCENALIPKNVQITMNTIDIRYLIIYLSHT